MRVSFFILCTVLSFSALYAQKISSSRYQSFDNNWRFVKDTASVAPSTSGYNDSKWRTVTIPHDWSIEDLPNQKTDTISGPFDRKSKGNSATGFTIGGTGWYRKTFLSDKSFQNKLVSIHFDGVYMNSDVWLNGHHLGNHPYGYTAFYYDLTSYLKPAGEENVIAVKVNNEGKNSRWYSGSGIYRHTWLTITESTHVAHWGVSVTTPKVSSLSATVQIETTINNEQNSEQSIILSTTLLYPGGKTVGQKEKAIQLKASNTVVDLDRITLTNPALWSVESPGLYKVITEIKAGKKIIDRTETTFGIRSIELDASKGFLLNGQRLILKGGCIHLDNGPLGAAAIDRAEERKIQLLKDAGYNAVRSSHSPPSKELLNACDRLGMLVVDEAFDMWELSKNPQDYHLYFKEWWKKDLQSMILRDRNHPSIIMWSIGNEIYEAPDAKGHQLAADISSEAKKLDPTRAVTAGIVFLPGYTKKSWEEYEPYLKSLDTDGYNYFLESTSKFFARDSLTAHRYDSEHTKHPDKTFIATEYTPQSAYENYEKSVQSPYFLGGFKWTAIDYLGEAGIGRPMQFPDNKKMPEGLMRMAFFYKATWPVYNAYCGDFDLVGNKKAASYYQDVVWGISPIELLVHRPIAEGMKEVIAPWGFPDELKSWTWEGDEGKKIQVNVYTRGSKVKLELNGKVIAEQSVSLNSISAAFEINYQPGTLIAKAYDNNGKEIGSSTLVTAGKPAAIRLVADRSAIHADLNDLSYVTVEVVDEKGALVPSLDDLEISFQIMGEGTIAAVGNGSFSDATSFQQNRKKVFQGKAMVIVRPSGKAGKITLTATAAGMKQQSIIITTK